MLLLVVAKNNPAPQDKEDRMEGGVVFFLSSPSLADYSPSLTQSNLFSPSFIIYTLADSPSPPHCLQLQGFFCGALAPVKTVTMQTQLTVSAHVAKIGCFSTIKYGFKILGPFLRLCV